MAERIWNFDEAFAAMCIMEEVAQSVMPDADQPWEDYRSQVGINQLRDDILTLLAHECDQAWSRTQARYEANPQLDDPGSFDYEFVPTWLRLHVEWTNNGPRVRNPTSVELPLCPTP
jgi:hypothetical protein